jgi:hypothetical protein
VFGGTVVTVTATVSDGGVELDGMPVSFATNLSTVAFSPATTTTGPMMGSGTPVAIASSQVFVPYGSAIFAIVSSGGASKVVPFSDQLPILTIHTPTHGAGVPATSGSNNGLVYPISVNVSNGSGSSAVGLGGVPLTFAATGAATFTPATILSDGSGSASSVLFVQNTGSGSAGSVEVVVTAAGVASPTVGVP